MASGTVTYTAPINPHHEIYNGRSAKTWTVTQTGSFPRDSYRITSVVIKYDIRTVYDTSNHMEVSRRDGGTDTLLGDVPTGAVGIQTYSLNTNVNYEGITTIKLDGVERWACQLRGGSKVEIVIAWESMASTEEEPVITLTGLQSISESTDHARFTDVSVVIDGADVTTEINKYLLSLSYTDSEEDETDDLQIKLQDRDGSWLRKWLNDTLQSAAASEHVSSKGLSINAAIRVYEPNGVIRYINCGSFELDSIKASGPPSTVTIKGTSLPYGNGVRTEERDKSWEGYTLYKIGSEIAVKAGLSLVYWAATDPYYRRLEQVKQTDISFLQELCQKNGFSLKASNGKLIIYDQSKIEWLDSIAKISFQDGTYTKYDLSTQDGDTHYAACTVRYYHPGQNKTIEGTAYSEDYEEDSEDNLMLIVTDERVESESEAKSLAEKLLRLHNKYEKKCSFTLLGNPLLGAGMVVTLDGFGLWDARYIIKQCKHEVGSSGFTTKVTLRTIPDKNVERMIDSEDDSNGGGGGNGNTTNNNEKVWQIIRGTTVYRAATGSASAGYLAKGTPISILGSTSQGRTLIAGGGLSGYVPSGCIGKV